VCGVFVSVSVWCVFKCVCVCVSVCVCVYLHNTDSLKNNSLH